ncbi:hypothetical protein I4F81_012675 [Pyropia yezoensis]|uniref:Uncharacterized protein n=1 Tax=Pyropia yezoensis TaxID=2788 RepID=A0ACC3CK07_PYRYE|nr:hypothetical protein I4F81_012675 [Neopyropia yezoensis]
MAPSPPPPMPPPPGHRPCPPLIAPDSLRIALLPVPASPPRLLHSSPPPAPPLSPTPFLPAPSIPPAHRSRSPSVLIPVTLFPPSLSLRGCPHALWIPPLHRSPFHPRIP